MPSKVTSTFSALIICVIMILLVFVIKKFTELGNNRRDIRLLSSPFLDLCVLEKILKIDYFSADYLTVRYKK